jgi:integral membrane protein (TIGR01906 family)
VNRPRPATERGLGRLTGIVVALAAALVLLGVSVVPLLTPAWIGFEQGRAGAAHETGYDEATLERVTQSIVHDLVLGGSFSVATDTQPDHPVLNQREIAHMQDVRGVLRGFGVVVLIALGVLVLTRRLAPAAARRDWWRAIRDGALGLVAIVAVLGVVATVAFDQAFEIFHELFFPAGSFSFDPATDRLVQLFPDQFWSETTLVLGAIGIVLAVATAVVASRRAALAVKPLGSTWPSALPTRASR